MARKYKLSFPQNKRAKESTIGQQVDKLKEETGEAFEAYMEWEEDAMLEEVWDVIFTAEGILRKYSDEKVEAAWLRVIEKARSRGDIK